MQKSHLRLMFCRHNRVHAGGHGDGKDRGCGKPQERDDRPEQQSVFHHKREDHHHEHDVFHHEREYQHLEIPYVCVQRRCDLTHPPTTSQLDGLRSLSDSFRRPNCLCAAVPFILLSSRETGVSYEVVAVFVYMFVRNGICGSCSVKSI